MRFEFLMKMPRALSVGLLVTLAACGTNSSNTEPAPPALTAPSVPAVAPSAEPVPPAAPSAAVVQPAPDPATREGRMAEALKGYEASKAAPQSPAKSGGNAAKKPQAAKKPAKAAAAKKPAKAASAAGS